MKPNFKTLANQIVMPWAMKWRYRRPNKKIDAPKIHEKSVAVLEKAVAIALSNAYELGKKENKFPTEGKEEI